MPEEVEYIDLYEVINFDGFDCNNWRSGERDLLQPQLEAKGYTDLRWSMGESDSFGPLSRICVGRDMEGAPVRFIYG